MATSLPEALSQARPITVFAAMGMEARPLRRRLAGNDGVRVEQGGIAAARWASTGHDLLLSCGLAGGLVDGLRTGTVVIPDAVALADGPLVDCDRDAVSRLREAATRLGHPIHDGPLVTVDHVVGGAERGRWAERGYVAVDMETATVAHRAARVAAVRIVLDTPQRELSPRWARPRRAMATPTLWGEAVWLARVGPRLCDVVARIVAAAFSPTPTAPGPGTSAPPARRGG